MIGVERHDVDEELGHDVCKAHNAVLIHCTGMFAKEKVCMLVPRHHKLEESDLIVLALESS